MNSRGVVDHFTSVPDAASLLGNARLRTVHLINVVNAMPALGVPVVAMLTSRRIALAQPVQDLPALRLWRQTAKALQCRSTVKLSARVLPLRA